MRLRAYKKEDSPVIAGWVRSEEELYRWSADRYNKFPLEDDDIDLNYAPQLATGRFIPLTAVDEDGKAAGHLIIRYPDESDDSSVRIGFVIVDPDLRGKGLGREMMSLAISYIKENLSATRVDLGVFDNNPKARKCYEAAGFKAFGEHDFHCPCGNWKCIDMEMFISG